MSEVVGPWITDGVRMAGKIEVCCRWVIWLSI